MNEHINNVLCGKSTVGKIILVEQLQNDNFFKRKNDGLLKFSGRSVDTAKSMSKYHSYNSAARELSSVCQHAS